VLVSPGEDPDINIALGDISLIRELHQLVAGDVFLHHDDLVLVLSEILRHKRPVVLEIFVRRREIQLHSGVHCVAERLLYYCLDVGGVRTIVPQVCC